MTLQTTCENCDTNWNVDQMVFCDIANMNLCPVCINNLLDSLASELRGATWDGDKRIDGILESF